MVELAGSCQKVARQGQEFVRFISERECLEGCLAFLSIVLKTVKNETRSLLIVAFPVYRPYRVGSMAFGCAWDQCGTLSRSWPALFDSKAAVTFLWLFVHPAFIEVELEVWMKSPLLGLLDWFRIRASRENRDWFGLRSWR